MRVGFYAGDPDLVTYLVETRKHAGLMAPTLVQAAAAAALGDDAHVDVQRARYAERRALVGRRARRRTASCTTAATPRSTSGCATTDGADDGWEIAARLAHGAGLLVSPGDLYGALGADHVRLALVQPHDRLELALDRLVEAREPEPRPRSAVDYAKQVTQLFEAGDDWRDVMPRRRGRASSSAR